jgi:HK97 family phage major capsid protein/HK97 family phage prohead protease
MTELLRRDFTAELHVRDAPDGEPPLRIIEGLVVPYGVPALVADRDAAGAFGKPYKEQIAPGAADGIDPAKVTLESSEHKGKLVGRGLTAESTDAGLHMALKVSKTPAGDELLELARDGVLTGMSIVFRPISQRSVLGGIVERTAIDIRRVAVLERGAYEDAQVTAVRADPDSQPPDAAPASEDRSPVVTDEKTYTTPEDRASRIKELTDGLERQAVEYPGVMPAEAKTRWDADNKELEQLKADAVAWEERQAKVVDILASRPEAVEADKKRVMVPPPGAITRDPFEFTTGRGPEETLELYRDDAMRITEKFRFPDSVDRQRSQDRIASLLDYSDSPNKELARRIKATGSPVYRRAFEKILKARGETYGLTPEEQRGTALAVGVDATGGFTVPFALDPTIVAIGSWSGAVNPYRRACRVVDIVGTDTWNAITSTAVVATRTTEAAASIEQGPTFAQPQYIVTRVQGQITASFEMFQDRADLGGEMAALIAEAKDNEEENSMAVGATAAANIGVGPVSGTSGAYTAVAGAGSGVLAEGVFTATEAALPVRHRFNAQWFMNRVNIRKAQSLETTGGKLFGGSQYPSVGNVLADRAGNTGLTLLGYPVNESPSLPVATTTTITAATLCNVSSYVIVDRIGLSVSYIPFIVNSSGLATGQQALYFMYRNTAKPINVDAGRTLRFL